MKKNKKENEILKEFYSEFDKGDSSFFIHLIAGSCAGLGEHAIMFPVDVIKTRLMAGRSRNGFCSTIVKTASKSPRCLFRGMPVAIVGAVPSHAALFATYEFMKRICPKQNAFYYGVSGIVATMFHDIFANSFGVIKTRIMLRRRGHYGGGYRMFRRVLAREGLRAFFVSYPISLAMNIPFVVGYFATYELLKRRLVNTKYSKFSPLICGGVAGGVAGLISNPFDVVRILLMNQSQVGLIQTILYNYKKRGLGGFLKGSTARAVYYIPSGTITWFTYETVKNFLSKK